MNFIKSDDLVTQIDFIQLAKNMGIKIEQYNDTVEYKGFCPFKKHNSPALFINKEKKLFYCFGCKKGGGIIKFVMYLKDMNFWQALLFLYEYAKEKELKEKINSVAIQFAT